VRAHGRAAASREVELVVLDHGPIIPPEIRAAAMSAAGQGSAKHRPDGRYGRGLALYVASIAARAAGGRIEIEERDGLSALALVLPEHEDHSAGG
jgi:K+-sensing histidine kinase KdpD